MSAFILTAQVRLQAPTNTQQVANQIKQQFKGISVPITISVPPQVQRNIIATNKNLTRTARVAKEAQGNIASFGASAAFAAKRFLAFTVAGGSIIKITSLISEGTKEAIKFEREMNKIAQATGSSAKEVSEISKQISKLSSTFGVSSQELAKASLILAQAGLTAKDTKKSLEALAKSDLAPTFDNIIDTTEGAIAVFNQFQVSADSLEATLSSMNAVAAKFAVESGDIITTIRRTGGAFQAAGGNLNELMALFTSVRQTTRESAESIATGFRTIFTRMQRPRTQNFLKSLGVDLTNMEGNFAGPLEAIRRLSDAMKNLKGTDPRFAQIIEELGGFRQVSKVIPLLKQFDITQKALNVAVAGSASLTEDAARAQETLAVQIQKVKEQFAAMIRTMVGSNAFKSMANVALQFASALIKIGNAVTPLLPLLSALAAFKLGQSISPFFQGFKSKKGLGFAKGGLVPGEGNGDTVPAMLTPGEFVLTKKTTKNLGLHRGGKVQRFADGGRVAPKYLSSNLDKDPYSKLGDTSGLKTFGVVVLGKGPRGQAIGTEQQAFGDSGVLQIPATKSQPSRMANLEVRSLSAKASKSFTQIIDNDLVQLVPRIGQQMASILGATYEQFDPKQIKKIPNYDSVVGGLFETAINSLGIPFDNYDNNQTFDFPKGLGGKAGLFNMSNPGMPVEAKKKWTSKIRGNIARKIQKWYRDNGVQDEASAMHSKYSDVFQNAPVQKPDVPFDINLDLLRQLNAGETLSLSNIGAFNISTNAFKTDKEKLVKRINEAAGKQLFAVVKSPTSKHGQLVQRIQDKAEGGLIGKPAIGGLMERNLGDIRRARRRRLTAEGTLDPQAKEYARRRNRRFAERRGALRVAQVFDFDDTLAMTDAKSFADYSGVKGKAFIDAAKTTQYTLAAKQASEQGHKIFVLTARASDSKKPIQDFATRAGINIPLSNIITIADDPSLAGLREPGARPGTMRNMTGPGKKAVILQKLASQFEKIFFYDDSRENILKAAGIKNVEGMLAQPKIAKFAKGGSVSDTVPAMLTPGEFVVTKDVVKNVGVDRLEKLNQSGGKIKGFAKGGLVGGGSPLMNVAGLGFAATSLMSVISSFKGLNEAVQKTIDSITMIGTQFATLYFIMQSSGDYFRKYTKNIDTYMGAMRSNAASNKISRGKLRAADDLIAKQNKLEQGRAASLNRAAANRANYNAGNMSKRDYLTRQKAELDFLKTNKKQLKKNTPKADLARIQRGGFEAEIQANTIDTRYQKSRIRAIRKEQRLSRGVSIATAGAGAISSIVGGLLEESGRKNLEAGTGGENQLKFGSALGTAGSWAGIGAAAGAMFGPLGMAVGGATGAVFGFYKGLKDAEKEIANIKVMKEFNASIEKTKRVLEGLATGGTTFDRAKAQAVEQAKIINKDLLSKDVSTESRQDILADTRGQLDNLSNYLNMAAKDVSTFDEFLVKAGPEVFALVAQLSNIPTNELRTNFQTIIDGNIKTKRSQALMQKAQDEYANRINRITNLGQIFETVSLSMQKFDNVVEMIVGFSEGVSAGLKLQDESAFLSDPTKLLNPQRFADVLNRDIRNNLLLNTVPVGQTAPLGAAMADDMAMAQQAIKSLPSILLDIRGDFNSFDSDNLVKTFTSRFEGSSEFIRNAMEQAAYDIIGEEGKEGLFLDKIKKDLLGTTEELSAAFKPLLETGALISAKMTEEANRRIAFVDKIVASMQKEVESRNRILEVQDQAIELRAQATKRPTNLNQLQTNDLQRQLNILGGEIGLVNNPLAIYQQILITQNKIQEQYLELQKKGIDNTGDLNKAMGDQQNRLFKLNNALKFLSDISSRTAIVMRKIEEAQAGAEFKRGLGERLTFAESPQELRDLNSQLNATRIAVSTGSIENVAPQFRQEVLDILNQIGDNREILGGMSGTEARNQLVANQLVKSLGIPMERALVIANAQTDELSMLQQQLEAMSQASIAASEALAAVDNNNTTRLIDAYNASVKSFASEVAQIIATQDVSRLNTSIAETRSNQASLLEKQQNLGLAATQFGGEANAQLIKANLELVKAVGEQTAAQEKFGNLGKIDDRSMSTMLQRVTSGGANRENFASIIEKFKLEVQNATGIQDITMANTLSDQINRIAKQKGIFNTAGNADANEIAKLFKQALEATQAEMAKSYANVDANKSALASRLGVNVDSEAMKNLIRTSVEISNNFDYWQKVLGSFAADDNFAKIGEQIVNLERIINEEIRKLNIAQSMASGAGGRGMHAGGWVYGQGIRDTVPAKLTPGEFVLSRQMVQNIGKENIAQLAKGGPITRLLNPDAMDSAANRNIELTNAANNTAPSAGMGMQPVTGTSETPEEIQARQARIAQMRREQEAYDLQRSSQLQAAMAAKAAGPEAVAQRDADKQSTYDLSPYGKAQKKKFEDYKSSMKAADDKMAQQRAENARYNKELDSIFLQDVMAGATDNVSMGLLAKAAKAGEYATMGVNGATRPMNAEETRSRLLKGTENGVNLENVDFATINKMFDGRMDEDTSRQALRKQQHLEANLSNNIFGSKAVGVTKELYKLGKETGNVMGHMTTMLPMEAMGLINRAEMQDSAMRYKGRGIVNIAESTALGEAGFGAAGAALGKAGQLLTQTRGAAIQLGRNSLRLGSNSMLGQAGVKTSEILNTRLPDMVSPIANIVSKVNENTLPLLGKGVKKVLSPITNTFSRGAETAGQMLGKGANAIEGTVQAGKDAIAARALRAQRSAASKKAYEEYMARVNPPAAPKVKTGPGMMERFKQVLGKTTNNLKTKLTPKPKPGRIEILDPKTTAPKAPAPQPPTGTPKKSFMDKIKDQYSEFKTAQKVKARANLKAQAKINIDNKLASERQAIIDSIDSRGTLPPDIKTATRARQILDPLFKKFGISSKLKPKSIKFSNQPYDSSSDPLIKNALGLAQGQNILARHKGIDFQTLLHEAGHTLKNGLTPTPEQLRQFEIFKRPIVDLLKKQGYGPKSFNYLQDSDEIFAELFANMRSMPKHTRRLRKIFQFNNGALVPGSGSGDKVPALLEPGEFVLNRNAVSAIGAGKLSQINKKIGRFQNGGAVKMQTGGAVGMDFSAMDKAVQNFGGFVDKFGSIADSMKGLQIQLMATHKVEVVINGAQVMNGLQDSIKNLVVAETNKAINQMLSQKFGLPPVDSAIS